MNDNHKITKFFLMHRVDPVNWKTGEPVNMAKRIVNRQPEKIDPETGKREIPLNNRGKFLTVGQCKAIIKANEAETKSFEAQGLDLKDRKSKVLGCKPHDVQTMVVDIDGMFDDDAVPIAVHDAREIVRSYLGPELGHYRSGSQGSHQHMIYHCDKKHVSKTGQNLEGLKVDLFFETKPIVCWDGKIWLDLFLMEKRPTKKMRQIRLDWFIARWVKGNSNYTYFLLLLKAYRRTQGKHSAEVDLLVHQAHVAKLNDINPNQIEASRQSAEDGWDNPDAQAPSGYELKIKAGLDAFLAEYGPDLIFVPPGKWRRWDGSRWEDHPSFFKEVEKWIEASLKKDGQKASGAKVREICQLASARQVFRHEHLDAPETTSHLVSFPSGKTVDLNSGIIRSAERTDYITTCTAASPDAAMQIPCWLAFLNDFVDGDSERIRLIGAALFAALRGDNQLHKCFVIFGPGGTGKTTFIETILMVFGSLGMVVNSDVLGSARRHDTTMASLRAKRLGVLPELSPKLNYEQFKRLVGSDTISARHCGEAAINFKSVITLIAACNELPILEDTSSAIKRRFCVIPTTDQDFSSSDKREFDLVKKLSQEAPGILNWVLDHRPAFEDFKTGKLNPESVRECTNSWYAEHDTVSRWLGENVQQKSRNEEGEEVRSTFGDLYDDYKLWTEASATQAKSTRLFSLKLRESGHRHRLLTAKNGTARVATYDSLYLSVQDATYRKRMEELSDLELDW